MQTIQVIQKLENDLFTLDYIKNYLRVDIVEDDIVILNIMNAAISVAEKYLNCCLSKKILQVNVFNNQNVNQFNLNSLNINPINQLNSITNNNQVISYVADGDKILFSKLILGLLSFNITVGIGNACIDNDILNAILLHIIYLYDNNHNGDLTYIPNGVLDVYNLNRKIRFV